MSPASPANVAEQAAKEAHERKPAHAHREPEPKPETPEVKAETKPEAPAPVAQPVLCGQPVAYRGATKPCVKPVGPDGKHEGEHSTRINRPAASTFDWSKFDAAKLQPQTFAPDEKLEIVAEPGERSDVQKIVDAQVKEAHAAWTASANKPKAWDAAIKAGVVRRYFLDPAEEDAYRSLLKSSERLYGLKIHMAPVQKHTSGEHMLPWFVVDKRTSSTAPAVSAPTEQPNS